ncbi:hypothetical protein BH23GEM9_BH23GEM9_23880 [soil metagenome]
MPPHVEVVSLDVSSVVVELMDSARVSATVVLSNGSQSPRSVLWACTAPELVEVCGPRIVPRDTGSFLLIAHLDGVADTASIRIYEEGMRAAVITDPSPSVPHWLLQGTGAILRVQITDSMNAVRLDRRMRWTSSDSSVALVRDTAWWNWNVGSWWPAGSVQPVNPGNARLTLTVGRQQATLDVVVRPRSSACDATGALSLDMEVGELRRFRGSDGDLPTCLQYRHARDAGRSYLMLAERLPLHSGSLSAGRRGVFLAGGAPAPDSMIVQMYTAQTPASQLLAAGVRVSGDLLTGPVGTSGAGGVSGAVVRPGAYAEEHAEWHIGTHRPRELPPQPGRALVEVRRGSGTPTGPGAQLQLADAATTLVAGDTLVIPLLRSIGSGAIWQGPDSISNRAVVRYVGDNLVFAEHIEMFSDRLRRFNGVASGPIPQAEYARIDAAYGPGQSQLDRLFGPSPTDTLRALPAGRELMVNTILPNGIWGTAAGDMAIIDYWYGTNGTTPSMLQDPLLLTNQVIVHEMAHVRHFLYKAPSPMLPWSVEGVARFAEHLAFAAAFLGSETPSRSGNVIAGPLGYPSNPGLQLNIEMPTGAGLSANFFGGYSGSAYLFDYLADHAEAAGGDGLMAVREVLLGAATPATADAAVARWMGVPMTLDELITRSRIALVLDNYPTSALLPPWTQYLQFNVRASRPWVGNWPLAVPGGPLAIARPLAEGVAWGVFINGDAATADQDFLLDVTRGDQSVISIVRFK